MSLPCGTRSRKYEQDVAIVRTKLQWGLFIVFIIFLFAFPSFADKAILRIVSMIGIVLIAVQGLGILTGYCGQISLAQAAFMAVGGYASAILTAKYGFPFWIALPCAGIIAGLIGAFFGAPSLRIKGLYQKGCRRA